MLVCWLHLQYIQYVHFKILTFATVNLKQTSLVSRVGSDTQTNVASNISCRGICFHLCSTSSTHRYVK